MEKQKFIAKLNCLSGSKLCIALITHLDRNAAFYILSVPFSRKESNHRILRFESKFYISTEI